MTTLDLWASDFTPEVIALAKSRILDGGNLATRGDLPQRTVKLAVLAVQHLNPHETFTQGEAAILYGVAPNTLKDRQKVGEMQVAVNLGK